LGKASGLGATNPGTFSFTKVSYISAERATLWECLDIFSFIAATLHRARIWIQARLMPESSAQAIREQEKLDSSEDTREIQAECSEVQAGKVATGVAPFYAWRGRPSSANESLPF
jgi:hypothetical protein